MRGSSDLAMRNTSFESRSAGELNKKSRVPSGRRPGEYDSNNRNGWDYHVQPDSNLYGAARWGSLPACNFVRDDKAWCILRAFLHQYKSARSNAPHLDKLPTWVPHGTPVLAPVERPGSRVAPGQPPVRGPRVGAGGVTGNPYLPGTHWAAGLAAKSAPAWASSCSRVSKIGLLVTGEISAPSKPSVAK